MEKKKQWSSRYAALRVRLVMRGHTDLNHVTTFLDRIQRVGLCTGVSGLVSLAAALRQDVSSQCAHQSHLDALV